MAFIPPIVNSALFDQLFGNARGTIIVRGASDWQALTPGTNGYALTSNGTGATPTYQAVSGSTPTLAQVLAAGNTSGAHDVTFEQAVTTTGANGIRVSSNSGNAGTIFFGTANSNFINFDSSHLQIFGGSNGLELFGTVNLYNSIVVNADAGKVPISINLASAQSAPALQVTSFGGTAGDRFQIAANGDATAYGTLTAANGNFLVIAGGGVKAQGDSIFGSNATPSAKFHVRGNGNTGATTNLYCDSADATFLLSMKNNGDLNISAALVHVPNLPTSPGAPGDLWVNSNVVQRS